MKFLKKDKSLDTETFLFLKLQPVKRPVLIKKKDKIEYFSSIQFEKEFGVKYIKNLYFENLCLLKKIVGKSARAIKDGDIAEKELWFGTYYEKELINGGEDKDCFYIKWIDFNKEYGLFALFDLPKDTFIGEYVGVVRPHRIRLDRKNGYCFEYPIGSFRKSKYTIDAKYMGNSMRFINHNKNPNLSLFPAFYKIPHIILKTNRFIKKDEELTYDYGPNYWKKREDPK